LADADLTTTAPLRFRPLAMSTARPASFHPRRIIHPKRQHACCRR